jgi:hypothetical protein
MWTFYRGYQRKLMSSNLLHILMLALLAVVSCGKGEPKEKGLEAPSQDRSGNTQSSDTTIQRDLFDFKVGVQIVAFNELLPSSAEGQHVESFVVDVLNCVSGREILMHDTKVSGEKIRLKRGDRGCSLSLRSFNWKGKVWESSNGETAVAPKVLTFQVKQSGGASETVTVKAPMGIPNGVSEVSPSALFTVFEHVKP